MNMGFSLENVLHTNFVPSEAQALTIRAYIAAKEAELARFDILESRALSDGLSSTAVESTQRDVTVNVIQAHRALLSPARRMPVEIIGEIFSHFIPDEDYVEANVQKTPLLLLRICRFWRDVALSTPQLWTSILIPRLLRSERFTQWSAGIEAWLSRAGSLPLSIDATCVYLLSFNTVDPFLDIIKSRYVQCRRLKLWLSGPQHIRLLECFPRGGPALETLEFHFDSCLPSTLISWPSPIPKFPPRLRNIAWHVGSGSRSGGPLARFHVDLPLPWSQLTQFHVDNPLSARECYHILQQCSRLRDCSFLRIMDTVNLASQTPLLCLPELHSIVLLAYNTAGPKTLLLKLILPSLLSLKITSLCYTGVDSQTPDAYARFLTQSSCPLATFYLSGARVLEPDLVECLQAVSPTLTELRIVDNNSIRCVKDRLVDLLTCHAANGGTPVLAPNLEILDFSCGVSVTDGTFGEMVASRRHSSVDPENKDRFVSSPVAQIKLVRVHFFSYCFLDKIKLESLCKEGWELWIEQ